MAVYSRSSGYLQYRVFRILTACLWVAACSTHPQKAPVHERRPPPSIQLKYHIVSSGETLYSIAWRYDLDYKALARHNGISSNYIIYPGQRLALDLGQPKITLGRPKSVRRRANRSEIQTKKVASKMPYRHNIHALRWIWPVSGQILSGFSSAKGLNKGIDIVGELGEPVNSAASGRVVYAGKGLRGYGNLLIIKHSEKYLSAYAHNRKLLVKEGQKVQIGQKIAEIGSSGTDRNKLHFEIRLDGKPVDPLKYLPKR
ncbi:MAG: peptidoglycan DD-metalloendopeptidase family protein [Exilibacterium sp.]